HKKQTGGSGQFARVAGYIEPLPDDAVEVYEFVDDVAGGSIPREFIPACDKGFKEAVKKGSLIGFPVVKVRCVINDGLSHAVDSTEQAFKTAALMGFGEAAGPASPATSFSTGARPGTPSSRRGWPSAGAAPPASGRDPAGPGSALAAAAAPPGAAPSVASAATAPP